MRYNPLETDESRKDFAEKLERHFKAVGNEIPIEWITLALDTEAGLAQLREKIDDEKNELTRLREENERYKSIREEFEQIKASLSFYSPPLPLYSYYHRWNPPYPWERRWPW